MGKSETKVVRQESSTSTPQATPEERDRNRLLLEREKFLDPQIRETQSRGLDLVSDILAGGPLEGRGFFERLGRGIDPEVTSDIVSTSLDDLNSKLLASGVGSFRESGAAQAAGVRTAGDIRRASEEFNIGALQNLLNLALSGQAQVQHPVLGFSNQLGQALAGLRPVTTTGSRSGSAIERENPFITAARFSPFASFGTGGPKVGFGG